MNALPPTFSRLALLATLIAGAGLIPLPSPAEDFHLELLSSGAAEKMGGFMPQQLTLSAQKPAEIKKMPMGLTAPLYGVIKLGPAESPTIVGVVLDEPPGKPPRLLVDANGNGDLQDDPPCARETKPYQSRDGKALTEYHSGATVNVLYGKDRIPLHLAMYRFDKKDTGRANFKNTLFYYTDYAREGNISLGDKTYKAMLVDRQATGDFRGRTGEKFSGVQLYIDLDGDGKYDPRTEAFDARQPFNIGGTTYEVTGLTASGDSFSIEKSTKTVAAAPIPGNKAATFITKTTAGEEVNFPSSYQGKLVILDFWATWCGPCVGELPHLKAAYEKFRSQGVDVLGVSLDKAGAAEKLAQFTRDKGMPWPQIYDGGFWSAEVAKLYEIHSIPSPFLVDGDTGMIIASGPALRGDNLEKTLTDALAKRKAK